MFNRLFKKPSKGAPSTFSSLDKLNETLELLEKKEKVLQKKVSTEIEKAKDFTKSKNKRAAIQCLKKKKLYEAQIEQLGNFQLRIHDQIIMVEGAKATTDTVDALRKSALALKLIQQSMNIDDIDKNIEEANEHAENMKQIQEVLAMPIGASADSDEDELEAELEELDGAVLEEELLRPSNQVPVSPAPVTAIPARTATSSEADEVATLRAEMAL